VDTSQKQQWLKHIDEALLLWHDLAEGSDDALPRLSGFFAFVWNVVCSVAGEKSDYAGRIFGFEQNYIKERWHPSFAAENVAEVLRSLRRAVEMGLVPDQAGLVRAELFGDFLDMAGHLHEEGYKDAAAVIAGSSLEAHLRAMSRKADTGTGNKRAAVLNDELKAANVYGKGDHKQITAWLDIRNDAAHGNYDGYGQTQVELMVAGIRAFIDRNPA